MFKLDLEYFFYIFMYLALLFFYGKKQEIKKYQKSQEQLLEQKQ